MNKDIIIETPEGEMLGAFKEIDVENEVQNQTVISQQIRIKTNGELRWASDGSVID